ncbi:MAG TPA: elongation factor EF-2 [Candidatus Woesearchaeota archaeon]|nr:MAG: elongation factor EF-2 [Candidatus Woesearchaeota archaeon]HDD70601.1 elongation factor EF-2 [Candidatus Woesearchaeota archaeon]
MAEKMIDKIKRLANNPEQIRNIATCAHIDHGKTTFSDNLLFGAGMMSETLAGKQLALDFHEDEKARGITIDSASVSMVHKFGDKEYLINLIDTPGHVDFGGDVTRAMRAIDGAILLTCAVEGVMPQTETVLRQALKERVKPVLFINKTDRLITQQQLTPEKMQERFVKIITEVNRLIREIAPEEFKEKWQVNVQEGSVAFGSAFHNWALSIPYMQEKGISFKDVLDAYASAPSIEEAGRELARKAPIHEVVLNMCIKHHPNPKEAQAYRIKKLWPGDLESADGKALLSCDPKGPLFYCPIKIVVDPQAGEIAIGRVFSGTISKGDQVYLNRKKTKARIQQVFIVNGAKREIVDSVPAGNVVGIGGVATASGETITYEPSEPFEEITHLFEPVITKAIEAAKPSDLPKLIDVLRVVVKEDPTLRVEINEETGEHLLHGMGELHLEIIENRIRKEKGVEVKTSPPIVVYRETVTKNSDTFEGKSPNKHNKLYFRVEPLDDATYKAIKSGEIREGRVKKKDTELRDKFVEVGWNSKEATNIKEVYHGNVFVDATRGIVALPEVIDMIFDMFEDVMDHGPIAKEPCIKLKVVLEDAKLHEDGIHRGQGQMYPAVRSGIRAAIMGAGPVLYEPLQIHLIEAPAEFTGEVTKLISNKRGQLLEMNQEGSRTIIKAKIPVAEMLGWSSDLRSATAGRGISSLVDQMFEKLPMELQNKIIQQIRDRKGLTESQVGA